MELAIQNELNAILQQLKQLNYLYLQTPSPQTLLQIKNEWKRIYAALVSLPR